MERLDAKRLPIAIGGFGHFPLVLEDIAQIIMCLDVGGVESQGLAIGEGRFCLVVPGPGGRCPSCYAHGRALG